MSDNRLVAMIGIIEYIFDGSRRSIQDAAIQSEAVNNFIDKPSCVHLQAAIDESNPDAIIFSNTFEIQSKRHVLFFLKSKPDVITVENMRSIVQISSVQGNALESLYHTVHDIFLPLLDHERNIAGVESKQSEVVNLKQEIEYWLHYSGNVNTKILISNAFKPLNDAFAPIDALKLSDLEDLIDVVQESLNKIWQLEDGHPENNRKPIFSQQRMSSFIDSISLAICIQVKCALLICDTSEQNTSGNDNSNAESFLWTDAFINIHMKLCSAICVCEKWCETIHNIINIDWKSNELRVWEENNYTDTHCKELLARLQQILHLRTVQHELGRILSTEEGAKFSGEVLFSPFKSVSAFGLSSISKSEWIFAVSAFEKLLIPLQQFVVSKIRNRISNLQGQPQLLLREFQSNSNLIQCSDIKEAITSERQILLSKLTEYINDLETAFDSFTGDSVIERVVQCQILSGKCSRIKKVTTEILDDLHYFETFKENLDDLILKTSNQEVAFVEEWKQYTLELLNSKKFSSQLRGKLMEISKTGKLEVNYSDKMIALIKEARYLAEVGHHIPSSIAKAAAEGERFYRYGIMLKKVAKCYNSIDTQIINTQKPLLLDKLLSFEQIVLQPTLIQDRGGSIVRGEITWANDVECGQYVSRLQVAANDLYSEKSILQKAHEEMSRRVCLLATVDMIKQGDLWRSKWQSANEIMVGLKEKYPIDRMAKWIRHWDEQVYKLMLSNYEMGLETLNKSLATIKAELVFENKMITFRPSLEEIRSHYHKKLNFFIAYPYNFGGFAQDSSSKSIFAKMPYRCSKGLARVFKKAEALIKRVESLKDSYKGWMVLSYIDLETYVDENVKSVDDFELNFKMLRAKCKEAENLPDFHTLDCITVSLVPLKSIIANQLEQLGDVLLFSIRKSIFEKLKEVETYLTEGMVRLGQRPKTVKEIGTATREWEMLQQNRASIKSLSNECIALRKLFLYYAPGHPIDTSEIVARMSNLDGHSGLWHEFNSALEEFTAMIQNQKEGIRDVLQQEMELFNISLDKFVQRWYALKPRDLKSWNLDEVQNIFISVQNWSNQLQEFKSQADELSSNCASFAMSSFNLENVHLISVDIESVLLCWSLFKDYSEEYNKLVECDWISFRTDVYQLQDFIESWEAKHNEKKSEMQNMKSVSQQLMQELEQMKRCLPCLKLCRGEKFKEEHWGSLLQGKLGLDRSVRLENLTLGHFVMEPSLKKMSDPSLLQFLKHLESQAQGEVIIREALQEVVAWSQNKDIKLMIHSRDGSHEISLIKDWKDLFIEIGDKQSLLASLKDSQFYRPFESTGAVYEVKLAELIQVLHLLNEIQRRWVYLEPIFGKGGLPSEAVRFKRIDEEFRCVMIKVKNDQKLLNLVDKYVHPGQIESLTASLDQLERCQKALADYLEAKREALPRFYFLGNDDLLEILGQSNNPTVIQDHLKKIFQGIHRAEFNEDQTKIKAILSEGGEVVQLQNPIKVTQKVENWLEELNKEMQDTLSALLVDCLKTNMDINKYPSQILCVAQQVLFCGQVESALLSRNCVDGLIGPMKELLEQYVTFDATSNPILQLKMKALVLDLIHNIDVVEQLQKAEAHSINNWAWQKQLRYYVSKDGKCNVCMGGAKFDYCYEYQGDLQKLVHTPLTDRCYLTLTQGMKMGFGGNPYGPAGTGKTESVKALGQALGRQVLVFNCDEGIDFKSMGRIFSGLIKCGAWGCFDEFNRLKEDQLSAVSQLVQVIQDAIKNRHTSLQLLGKTIDVNFNAGIFVTMNPAGKGYGGRSKLPDNLKALFRPVAMGRPDNDLIAEVILYSEGFKHAKVLSSKIVNLFLLAKQMLSPQQHYDWGLRALKAVLNTGGKLIQEAKFNCPEEFLGNKEHELLIKAVRVNTLSKLTHADTNLFLSLLGDVFPGIKSADISGGELEVAIEEVMVSKPWRLMRNECQIRKMIQLKESLHQRMGCVIVGPSGCGKSTIWKILQAAMIKCGQAVITHVLNPKSMPRERLLGKMDLDTREWTDGVLTSIARRASKETPDTYTWVICDGDIDPEWIENLNSVLDDNHLLTLPNGERIKFGSNVNFLFETHHLIYASPATVSRMGMIYVSNEDLHMRQIVECWIKTQDNGLQDVFLGWMENIFYKAFSYVMSLEMIVDTTMVGKARTAFSQITNISSKAEFLCGIIRGMGGNISFEHRKELAKKVFMWANEVHPDISAPLDVYVDSKGDVSIFQNTVTTINFMSNCSTESYYVAQVVSTQRVLSVLNPWIESGEPFMLVGPEGCGKNMILQHAFQISQMKVTMTVLHCNACTSAEDLIAKIEQVCSLHSSSDGQEYRPPVGTRLVIYLKGVHLPHPDRYGTSMLIALLQQLITIGGFYNDTREFVKVKNMQLIGSMSSDNQIGLSHLSTRFAARMHIAICDCPDSTELGIIYSNMLHHSLTELEEIDARWKSFSECQKLARVMIAIFNQLKETFNREKYAQCLFTIKHLTAWCKGLLRYNLRNEEDLLDCFAYEGYRLFQDRHADNDDKLKLAKIFSDALQSNFGHNINLEDSHFVTFSKGLRYSDERNSQIHYLTRTSTDTLRKSAVQSLMYYKRENVELESLLTDEALGYLSKVDRVLSYPGGHLLLVGRTGVGRREAVKLATYMQGYIFTSLALPQNAKLAEFHFHLKNVLSIAGVRGESVVYYIEECQITCDSILVSLNSLLCSGEVPGLYTKQEIDPLLAPLREQMLDEGKCRTLWEFFVMRIRMNLHLVLSMDSSNNQFSKCCNSSPALYMHCQFVWFADWNEKTMLQVPLLISGIDDTVGLDINLNKGCKESVLCKRDLIEVASKIHQSCSINLSASPFEYIAFIKTWHGLYDAAYEKINKALNNLHGGLNKLTLASVTVDELKSSAAIKQKDLMTAQSAADDAMDQITNAIGEAAARRAEVEILKKKLAGSEQHTQARKINIEQELSAIKPILDEAKQAVGSIKSDNLNEIRSLKMPPEPIADVLGAVLVLLGIKDTSWLSMKKFLGNRGVKEDILNYDAHRMSSETRVQVCKILKQKESSFEPSIIRRVSVAAAPLAAWVKANVQYSIVLDKLRPLEAELDNAVNDLCGAQARLEECEQESFSLDECVQKLKLEFGSRSRETEVLRTALNTAQDTLDKAQSLLGQLGGEKERWSARVKCLTSDLNLLPLTMLLNVGFCTYLARANESVRATMIQNWCSIAGFKRDKYDFCKSMAEESQLLTYISDGLPPDNLSKENALSVASCFHETASLQSRVPFIIDPASVAATWIHSFLARDSSKPLEVINSGDARFSNAVELAVRFGKTLLILEADGLEAMLYPLVRKDFQSNGSRSTIQIGDKAVEYNSSFRMVLMTRNYSPNLSPCAAALVVSINFSITKSCLVGQLLAATIQHERPELETKRCDMLIKQESFKVQLTLYEGQLLEALASADGNLLQNKKLLSSLSNTKTKAAEVEEALKISDKTGQELDKQRNVYRPFATKGSTLFLLLDELKVMNPMYRFSLEQFFQIFNATLTNEDEKMHNNEADFDRRLDELAISLISRVIHFIGRALFKDDRVSFAVHILHGMKPDLFDSKGIEWCLFTGQKTYTLSKNAQNRKIPNWVSKEREMQYLCLIEHLPHLAECLENTEWQNWGCIPQCELYFPHKTGLTAFQQILLIQAVRPDRLQAALIRLCCEIFKLDSIDPPQRSLVELCQENGSSNCPILITTLEGVDPCKEIEEVAVKEIGQDHYREVAMGGGQEQITLDSLKEAAKAGDWICLKNLHLVVHWLPVLCKEISSLKQHPSFRLWLTSQSHPLFPPALLQMVVKIAYESPPGVKQNMLRTYDLWTPKTFSGNLLKSQVLYMLAWFHAVVQERQKFCPQGWTKPYEFSYGDLRMGSLVISDLCTANSCREDIDWDAIQGLMEDAIYGGRVENVYDMRMLKMYLHYCFGSKLLQNRAELAPGMKVPNGSNFYDYIKSVRTIPDADVPAILKLPNNIERSVNRIASDKVISQLYNLEFGSILTVKMDNGIVQNQVNALYSQWETLLENAGGLKLLLQSQGTKQMFSKELNYNSPIQIFVDKEVVQGQSLISIVNSDLLQILKVSHDIGRVDSLLASALIMSKVPTKWSKLWEGPEKVQTWLSGLIMRMQAILRWQTTSNHGKLIDGSLNLCNLFNPNIFLNALWQQTARVMGCDMDTLDLFTIFDSSLLNQAKISIVVEGLLLQGALFCNNMLTEQSAIDPDFTKMPPLKLAFLPRDRSLSDTKTCAKVTLPLYISADRHQVLCEIQLPYQGDGDKWILAGCALILPS